MIEVNRNGDVWVFAEQQDGQIHEVSLELLGRAKELAKTLSVKPAAVVAGRQVGTLADKLISHGAETVYVIEDDRLADYQSGAYCRAMCGVIEKHRPQIVLYGATPMGRDLAPRIASKMKSGLTADCTDLQIGDYTSPTGAKEQYKNLLLQIRPAFGGNIIATIVNPQRWPQMATVREGVMPMLAANGKLKGTVVLEKADISPEDLALTIIERHRQAKKVNLKASRIIVAGGAGIGGKEGFRLIWDLANVLGGAPAGSRAAVDLGFIDHDHQVGQTGTTVRPALYIAVGISGAVQHVAGMNESAKIVAINTDPDAPIFQVAHYGIVGDFNDVVPRMIKAIRTKS
jgi:electron transfer flavoprotein alpha subunit